MIFSHRPVVFAQAGGELVGTVIFGDKIKILGADRIEYGLK